MGAQSPEEGEAYTDHLQRCTVCRGLVSQFQAVADLLPDALEEETASPALKQRVLDQARADLDRELPRPAPPMLEEQRRPGGWRWPAWLSPVPAAVFAVLVLAIAGLGAWNVILGVSIGAKDGTLAGQSLLLSQQGLLLAEQRQLLEAIGAGARVSRLTGTEAAPGASAALVQVPGAGSATLLIADLPQPPPGRQYQVWRIAGGTPEDAGTINLTDSRGQLIELAADFFGADAIGVSIEPEGGSLKPTGDIVLLGNF